MILGSKKWRLVVVVEASEQADADASADAETDADDT